MIANDVLPPPAVIQPHSSICDTAIAQIMLCEKLIARVPSAPSPEESGEAILASHDLCEVDNAHLAAPVIRFEGEVPYGAHAITGRLGHMIHAGVAHLDKAAREEALHAHDVILAQLCGADSLEDIAEQAAEVQQLDPEVIEACLRLDLGAVPCLVDEAVALGADEKQLVSAVASLFVIAAAFKVQLEACLGYRLLHYPLNGRVAGDGQRVWTIGQVFSPHLARHEFAVEMMELFEANLAAGVTEVKDRRPVRRIKRMAARFGIYGLEPANDLATGDQSESDIAREVGSLLQRYLPAADAAATHFRNLVWNQRHGRSARKRVDALSAPITAVQRLAIVCARALEVARLARTATTADDLRGMLGTSLPKVLRASSSNYPNVEALRLRMLFHAARVAFLRDGEHLPKSDKRRANPPTPSVELHDWASRRARNTMKACHDYLAGLPRGWRFATWFGWDHDSLMLEEWHERDAA